jgi:hypothetical protein
VKDLNGYMLEETIIKYKNCPKCKGKGAVEMHIARELQQKPKHIWVVEHCTNDDCDYYWGGFKNV